MSDQVPLGLAVAESEGRVWYFGPGTFYFVHSEPFPVVPTVMTTGERSSRFLGIDSWDTLIPSPPYSGT